MQSLFSLEVIVNFVKLYKSPNVSCLFPCVAFRLLDYPTIAINLVDNYDAKELKTRLELNTPFDQIEKLPCFVELLDRYGRYLFAKGKSCLFRADMNVLKGHLQITPMYLMLLDTFFEPYKLIGTTLVPLNSLINKIHEETKDCDDMPCTKMTHGVFELKNLMGEEIGHISFVSRLTSFGSTLMPHIPITTENAQRRLKAVEIEVKKAQDKNESNISNNQHRKTSEPETEIETFRYELKKTKDKDTSANMRKIKKNQDALIQTTKIDYQDAEIQITDHFMKREDTSIQSNSKLAKVPSHIITQTQKEHGSNMYQIKHEPDDLVVNYFCPPALHYNSIFEDKNILKQSNSQNSIQIEKTNVVNTVVNQKIFINNRVEYLKKAKDLEEINLLEVEDLNDERGNQNDENIEYFIRPRLEKTVPKIENINLEQMPLLKCLFDEISMLKNLMDNKNVKNDLREINFEKYNREIFKQPIQQNNKPINKPKTKPTNGILRKSVKYSGKLIKPVNTISKETILRSVNRLSMPRDSMPKPKPVVNKELSHDETPVGPKPSIQKPPKTPLKYGTTNAHRMRVLANNPNKAREIEIKHQKLLYEIKSNLDELNLSSGNGSGEQLNESVRKNLEKVLFESTGSTTYSGASVAPTKLGNLKNNNSSFKPIGNFSLLNKVDIESTNEFGTLKQNSDNNIQDIIEQVSDHRVAVSSPTKMVQFGHTYVMNNSSNTPFSDSSGQQNSPNSNVKLDNRKSLEYDESTTYSKNLNKNVFIDNKNRQYDEDFASSFESSSHTKTSVNTTQSNFFTGIKIKEEVERQNDSDYEEEDWDLDEESQGKEKSSILNVINNQTESNYQSSSKFSSDDFS